MARVQLALNVSDVDAAVDFYRRLFATEPAKRRPGYANFAIDDPPLKLVLIEGGGAAGSLNHLGGEVAAEADRLAGLGHELRHENGVTCCHAVQDKFWIEAPDARPWEVYTVLADAPSMTNQAEPGESACCTPAPVAAEPVSLGRAPLAGCGVSLQRPRSADRAERAVGVGARFTTRLPPMPPDRTIDIDRPLRAINEHRAIARPLRARGRPSRPPCA